MAKLPIVSIYTKAYDHVAKFPQMNQIRLQAWPKP